MKPFASVAAAVSAAATLLLLLLPSCQGRTMENMTPTGDTVEVIIDSPTTGSIDSSTSADTTIAEDSDPSLPTP